MLEGKRGHALSAPTVVTSTLRPDLVGRRRECELLEKLLESARAGRGAVLVVHGEPGVGKTALLDYVVQKGDSFRIARTVGVEGEIELPFAALQQLCAPILALRMGLPPPQRDALGVAFGLAPGNAPSPFLLGLAVLGLLSEAAEDRPLLCVVDDAQWLDQASAAALAFVAPRFVAEKVVLLFATRAVGETLVGLPELRVEPLGHEDARALLASFLPAPLDAQVLEQVVVETRGNPLGLLELPRGLTPAQIAGGFGLPAAVPVHAGIEALFAQRLAALPPDARLLLLIAAADATGDAALMRRAVLGEPSLPRTRGNRRARLMGRSRSSRPQRQDRSTSFSGPRQTFSARGSSSPPTEVARHRRCCSPRRNESSHWTRVSRAR